MGRIIFFLIIQASLIPGVTGCADFKLHMKDEARNIKPHTILIGLFESRNMIYDPYAAEEFRDALKFELFRKGYNAILVQKNEPLNGNEIDWAAKICRDNIGEMLIKGVISQRESGFLADRETETIVSFTIYAKNGVVLGEAFYRDNKSAGTDNLRRSAADKFVTELIKTMEQVK